MADLDPSAQLRYMIEKVSKRPGHQRGIGLMKGRAGDFENFTQMQLAGISLDPVARAYADSLLDAYWEDARADAFVAATQPGRTNREVIIGGGYHAAVYAASRVLAGFPAPLVIERGARPGGTFAMGGRPTFYLNNRNRDGGPGLAGDLSANLSYLPGAPIQASMVSPSEYGTDDDMAWVIRLTLAQYATVLTEAEVADVQDLEPTGKKVLLVAGKSGQAVNTINASRIIDARGLGDPVVQVGTKYGPNIITFQDFLRRMGGPAPLRGVKRMAVVGDGDAARVVIESALGLAPAADMTAMGLDAVERVDAYAPGFPDDCGDWGDNERGRYRGIGRYLRPDRFGQRRLNVIQRRGVPVAIPGSAIIDGRSYDLVVMCIGNTVKDIKGLTVEGDGFRAGGLIVARRTPSGRVYRVGPHARIPFSDEERAAGVANLNNNRVAMFRLGTRTAALAATLPPAEFVGTDESLADKVERERVRRERSNFFVQANPAEDGFVKLGNTF